MDRPNRHVEETEALLRRSRPLPRVEFASSLADRLFPSGRHAIRQRPRRRRPILVSVTAAGATACAVLVLSLAGVGPLAAGGSQEVGAKSECKYVSERRRERVPTIVRAADGRSRVTFAYRSVERRVKRCR